jgi:nitrite reductase/ring-hydroxylating ferredoxin subunit
VPAPVTIGGGHIPEVSAMRWDESPHAPPAGTVLCRLDALDDRGVHGVVRGEGRAAWRVLLCRDGDAVAAYVNVCPHFRIPLDATGGTFVTTPGYLWCGYHAAKFRAADGFCVDGPCKGASLDPVPIVVADGLIRIAPSAGDGA